MEDESSSSFHPNPLIYNKRHSYLSATGSSSGDLSSITYAYPDDALTANCKQLSYNSFSVPSPTKTYISPSKYSTTSIYGPTQTTKQRCIFMLIIATMTFCGINNDFLGKLSYQSLPGASTGLIGFKDRYWIAWLLTFGTFIICSKALVFGWNKGREWRQMKREWKYFLFNVSIPGTCDVWVNGGRYIGLVFLPAAVVTIMKNGTQLLFSALFRKIFEKKTLSFSQTIGILLVTSGLLCVCIASFLNDSLNSSLSSMVIGIFILVSVGFFGSLRNHYEQILCRDMEYNANFVVGMRSIVSIVWTAMIGIFLLFFTESSDDEININYLLSFQVFVVTFLLFLIAIYGKNVTQMKVIELSSALTRNLTMQFMPIGTWIMSLIFYYGINQKYGEEWNKYCWIQLAGFIIVLIGSYYYMKVQKTKSKIHQAPNVDSNVELHGVNT